MNFLRLLLQNLTWPGLVVSIVVFLGLGLFSVKTLFTFIEPLSLIVLVLCTLGLVGIVGGYFFTKHVGFELYPKVGQIVGALIVGFFSSVMIYSSLQLLAFDVSRVGETVLLGLSAIFFIEFFLMRISQARSVTMLQLGSLFLVTFGVTMILRESPEFLYVHTLILLGSGISALVVGRLTHTYLLSPWVNSFWSGWTVLFAGLILLPMVSTSGFANAANEILQLPLWLGAVVGFLSVSTLLFRQLKHKLRIAKGYMQYKLQLLTMFFAFLSLLIDMYVSYQLLLAFFLIVIAYSVAEGRVIVRE